MQTQEVEKMEENKMDKNLEHVNEIVKTMEKYASGDYFIYNGDLFPIDRDEFAKEEGCLYREGVYIMHDGKEIADNEDHPRLRGKDVGAAALIVAMLGSPPLTRERQNILIFSIIYYRITPAYAGKTVKDPFILATIADFKSQIYLTSVQGVLPASPSPMLDKAHFHESHNFSVMFSIYNPLEKSAPFLLSAKDHVPDWLNIPIQIFLIPYSNIQCQNQHDSQLTHFRQ